MYQLVIVNYAFFFYFRLTFEARSEEFRELILVFDVKDAINYGFFASRPVLGQVSIFLYAA